MLNSLASVLWTRFGQTGQIEDIDEAIALHWEALRLRPAPHPNQYMSLNNLANILDTRFSQTGQIKDVDEAPGSTGAAPCSSSRSIRVTQ
jgi:hypothetical protein